MGLYDNETIWRHIQNDYCFMFKMALQLTTRMHTILQHSDTNRLKNYILSIKNHQRAIGDFSCWVCVKLKKSKIRKIKFVLGLC